MFTDHKAFAASSNPHHRHPTCHCVVYPFPHRASGGACEVSYCCVTNYAQLPPTRRIELDELCAACGRPADTIEMDFGIGSYEFWGQRCTDTNWQTVSACCESHMVPNTAESAAEHKDQWKSYKEESNA